MSPALGEAERAYLDCLERSDLPGALQVVLPAMEEGAGLEQVTAILVAAQAEVGARWQRGEWTVAQEHAATAITERVAGMAAAAERRPAQHPTVVVVCAEGEWHTLPPRLLSDGLQALGWDARFLGGSIPAADLRRHLREVRPLALAVSCTLPVHLPGALATIEAGHAAGVAVLAGGRAFGAAPLRAAGLGADGWALDALSADGVLQHWADGGVEGHAAPDAVAVSAFGQLHAEQEALLQRVEDEILLRFPETARGGPARRQRTREDVRDLIGALEATVLTDDPSILRAQLPWLLEVSGSRGVPGVVVHRTVGSVLRALELHGFPAAAELLQQAAEPALV